MIEDDKKIKKQLTNLIYEKNVFYNFLIYKY